MNFRQALGQAIRETRYLRRLKLRELSERSFVALSYISEVERGVKEVSSEMLASIAEGLQVPTSYLIITASQSLADSEMREAAELEVALQLLTLEDATVGAK